MCYVLMALCPQEEEKADPGFSLKYINTIFPRQQLLLHTYKPHNRGAERGGGHIQPSSACSKAKVLMLDVSVQV